MLAAISRQRTFRGPSGNFSVGSLVTKILGVAGLAARAGRGGGLLGVSRRTENPWMPSLGSARFGARRAISRQEHLYTFFSPSSSRPTSHPLDGRAPLSPLALRQLRPERAASLKSVSKKVTNGRSQNRIEMFKKHMALRTTGHVM